MFSSFLIEVTTNQTNCLCAWTPLCPWNPTTRIQPHLFWLRAKTTKDTTVRLLPTTRQIMTTTPANTLIHYIVAWQPASTTSVASSSRWTTARSSPKVTRLASTRRTPTPTDLSSSVPRSWRPPIRSLTSPTTSRVRTTMRRLVCSIPLVLLF